MFTGLIQQIGTVRRVSYGSAHGRVLEVAADGPWSPALADGESVAVNGVCLTVVRHDARRFTADVLEETATHSTVGGFRPGTKVNLERALRAGDRFGGHVVQGHVDGVGTLTAKRARGRDFVLRFACPRAVAAATVLKGSIAIDGVSLTVSGLGDDWLEVNAIPVTLAETTLGALAVGGKVNLESDVLGRYAVRREDLGATPPSGGGLTFEKLAENGFC